MVLLDYSCGIDRVYYYFDCINYMNEEKLTKAKYGEWQLSLFGACFIAGGIGALLASYLALPIILVIMLIGIVMHGVGMYRIHQRNK